ncbi:hypothetical protein GCM10027589_02720 [Actinocorallia lasiicapitis]
MGRKDGRTSKQAATDASETLRDPNASPQAKAAAASALSQASGRTTKSGARTASDASETMRDADATPAERSAAASTLSQKRNRK